MAHGTLSRFQFRCSFYWDSNAEDITTPGNLNVESLPRNYLDDDLCIVDGEYYFVRGLIYLPIIGTGEYFRWGVWGSLSKENFIKLVSSFDDADRAKFEPMFSWLSSQLDEYEDTLNLKMYAHIDDPGIRPSFELEPTDHQLSLEYHHGVSSERVKQIMTGMLKEII